MLWWSNWLKARMLDKIQTSGAKPFRRRRVYGWLRSAVEYLSILSVGLALVAVLEKGTASNIERAMASYKMLADQRAHQAAAALSSSLGQVYQNLRTIGLLPSVIKIDRHGAALDGDSRLAIQQIANNLMSNVAASKVYIVPDDFHPDAIDAATGKPEQPILTFDKMMTMFSATVAKSVPGAEVAPEAAANNFGLGPAINILEFRQLQSHLAWLKQRYPVVGSFSELQPPVISGPEVLTSDNSEYENSKVDADRIGVLFSVPFYGPDGHFKGTITAVIRTKALQRFLPSRDYALTNPAYHYLAPSLEDGQQNVSRRSAALGEPDPGLLFSAVVPITINDPAGKWFLWAGQPNAAFFESGEVQAIQSNRELGWALSVVLVCLLISAWTILKRRRQAERVRHKTEKLAKTEELQAAAAAMSGLDGALRTKKRELEASQDQMANEHKRAAEEQAALIATLGAGLSRLASGDLTIHLRREAGDPFNPIKDNFLKAVEELRNIASVTATAAEQVTGRADYILDSVADLTERTEEQSTSLMETAAAMEQMSAMVHQNASNAQEAKRGAIAVRDMSVDGSEIAQAAIAAVGDIDGASKQISAIVGFIEEIASQTNILALNAAVEAARAGEAGSGFSVIAGEVRSLSQRSTSALREIKSVITLVDSRVSTGVSLVKRAGTALAAISQSAVKVADLMSDIAGATLEQATSIEQVTRAVSDMDAMTQQNAALAEEATKALRSSQAHIADLRQAVSFFKTGAPARPGADQIIHAPEPGAFMRAKRRVKR